MSTSFRPRKIRTTVTETHDSGNSVYMTIPENVAQFRLIRKRTQPRTAIRVRRNPRGIFYIVAWCPSEKNLVGYYEKDVKPEYWARIVTDEVKEYLRPIEREETLTHYRATKSYDLVKTGPKTFQIGCQTIGRAHLLRLCREILKHEG